MSPTLTSDDAAALTLNDRLQRDRYLRFNQEYPGDWHLRAKMVIADEHHGALWFEWRVGDHRDDGMAFFEFAGVLITRVTDFWPEPYEPPPGREHLVERF